MVGIFSFTLLFLTNALLTQCQGPPCHVPGQCSGGIFINGGSTNSYNQCLNLCNTNPNCNWFTYFGERNECIEFNDCPTINTDCNNCFSGQDTCPQLNSGCEVEGICTGHFITSGHFPTLGDCLDFCKSTQGCNFYSYLTDTMDCFLTEDCVFLDDSCSNCLTGKKECEILSKIMVVGGNPPYNKVEIVDLNGMTGSCPAIAEYPGAPYATVGTYMADTGAMACGGYDGTALDLSTCYVYTPDTNSWGEIASMIETRGWAAAVQLSPDKWWVTGGTDNSGAAIFITTEVFTTSQGFVPFVDLPEPRRSHNLVRINSTHIMLLGGATPTDKAWMFNMDTESWTELPDLPVATSFSHAGLVIHTDGRHEVVVAAGRFVKYTQIFSLEDMSWRFGSDFPAGNLYLGSSVPRGSSFLVVGGWIEAAGGAQDTIFEYQVETGEWLLLPQKLTLPRDVTAAFMVPDQLVDCNV